MSDLQRVTDLKAQRQELQSLVEESRNDGDIELLPDLWTDFRRV